MPDWDALLEAHRDTVWRVCARWLSDRTAIEDAFQETFVSAIRLADRMAGRGETVTNWEAMLVRLASSRAIDLLRRRSRRPAQPIAQGFDPAGRGDSPIQVAVAAELSERLATATANLPERAAEIFAMVAVEGQSHAEVAAHLGMTPSAVAVALHRARKQLQAALRLDD